ncbi:MAG: hypothetical protein Q7T16_06140 [Candidatus Burarchaeum sp.]|nr:hypothetical protein [Candidatus Burarchaeum sp.]MDO8340208.1 hypothetical protein [Candidatus Burarchaeum sp.]
MQSKMNNPIRVGIRGIAGRYGQGLVRELAKRPDEAVVTLGIEHNNATLKNLITGLENLPKGARGIWPKRMLLEEGIATVKKLNSSQKIFEFDEALGRSDIGKLCDVFVDVTRGAKHFEAVYWHLFDEVPVFLMADEYHDTSGPRGRLIAPPLAGEDKWSSVGKNVWRVGDCIVSSLARLFGGLKEDMSGMGLHAVTLLDRKTGYPSVAKSTSLCLGEEKFIVQWHDELNQLFGRGVWAKEDMSLVHVFATNYYIVNMSMGLKQEHARKDVLEFIKSNEKVMVLGQDMCSTDEIEEKIVAPARGMGMEVPPVLVFEKGLDVQPSDEGTNVKLSFAIQCYEIGSSTFAQVIRQVGNGEL